MMTLDNEQGLKYEGLTNLSIRGVQPFQWNSSDKRSRQAFFQIKSRNMVQRFGLRFKVVLPGRFFIQQILMVDSTQLIYR